MNPEMPKSTSPRCCCKDIVARSEKNWMGQSGAPPWMAVGCPVRAKSNFGNLRRINPFYRTSLETDRFAATGRHRVFITPSRKQRGIIVASLASTPTHAVTHRRPREMSPDFIARQTNTQRRRCRPDIRQLPLNDTHATQRRRDTTSDRSTRPAPYRERYV